MKSQLIKNRPVVYKKTNLGNVFSWIFNETQANYFKNKFKKITKNI